MGSNFEGTSSWNDAFVFHGVLDGSKSVSDGFLGLGNGVIVWSLDEDGAREWVLNSFNEGVFVVSENLLIDSLGETEIGFTEVINTVELLSSASEWDSLSVSLLCSSDTNNAISSQKFEGWWVDTLLVHDNKVFVVSFAHLSLEVNNLLNLIVSELSLGGNQLLSLVGVGPEETGMDFGLFVLEGDVETEDVAVVEGGWQVGVSATVIEDETSDELGFSGHLVLHVHNFNHVQIDFSVGNSVSIGGDGLDGIDEDLAEWVGNAWVDLGVEGGFGNLDQEVSGDFLGNLEFLQETKCFHLGLIHTFNKDSWMDSVTDVSFGLSHEFSDEKNVGGSSISNDIVLGGGSSTNHSGGGVLDLHLVEEDGSILGELDLTSSTDEHLNSSLWPEVGLENLLQSLSGIDVDSECLSLSDDIRVCVDELK